MKSIGRCDKGRAILVWVFPLFAVAAAKIMLVKSDWPAFWDGVLMLALFEMVTFASWGFWTGRLR